MAHNHGEPVGIGRIADSSAGLIVHGELVMEDPAAQRAHVHLKKGSIAGLSIGFTVPEGKSELQRDGTRLLREIKLFEISLVACPANPQATIVSVKDVGRVLSSLRSEDVQPADRATLLAELRRLTGKDSSCGCGCQQCLDRDCSDCSDEDCTDPNCELWFSKTEVAKPSTIFAMPECVSPTVSPISSWVRQASHRSKIRLSRAAYGKLPGGAARSVFSISMPTRTPAQNTRKRSMISVVPSSGVRMVATMAAKNSLNFSDCAAFSEEIEQVWRLPIKRGLARFPFQNTDHGERFFEGLQCDSFKPLPLFRRFSSMDVTALSCCLVGICRIHYDPRHPATCFLLKIKDLLSS